ncbi:phosphoserine phosphatase SerB, partial [Mesorhizobium sp. M8A.F.Ca.ET.208.01.1.1]
MSLIATLVSRPEARAVPASLANMALRAAGASAVQWLAEDVACDLVLPQTPDVGEMTANLRAALASEPIDIIVQPAEGRRKKILLADMDS